MTNLYLIRNVGCDDTTLGLARMTDEELNFFKKIIDDLNKNSTYGCMPVMEVYKVDEDMLREPNDDYDDRDDIFTVDDHKYVFKVWSSRYGDGMEKVIGK